MRLAIFIALLYFATVSHAQTITCEVIAKSTAANHLQPFVNVKLIADGRWNVTGTDQYYYAATAFKFFKPDGTEIAKRVPSSGPTIADRESTFIIPTHHFTSELSGLRVYYNKTCHQQMKLHINSTEVTTFNVTCKVKAIASLYRYYRRDGWLNFFFSRPVGECVTTGLPVANTSLLIPNTWFKYDTDGEGYGNANSTLCNTTGLLPYQNSLTHFFCKSNVPAGVTSEETYKFTNMSNLCDLETGTPITTTETNAFLFITGAHNEAKQIVSRHDPKGRIKQFVVSWSAPVDVANFTALGNYYEFLSDSTFTPKCTTSSTQPHPALIVINCDPFYTKPSETEARRIGPEMYFAIPGTLTKSTTETEVLKTTQSGFNTIDEYDDLIPVPVLLAYLNATKTGIIIEFDHPEMPMPHVPSFVVYKACDKPHVVLNAIRLGMNKFEIAFNSSTYGHTAGSLWISHLQLTAQTRYQPLITTEDIPVAEAGPDAVVASTDCDDYDCLSSMMKALYIFGYIGIVLTGVSVLSALYMLLKKTGPYNLLNSNGNQY